MKRLICRFRGHQWKYHDPLKEAVRGRKNVDVSEMFKMANPTGYYCKRCGIFQDDAPYSRKD